MRFTRNIQSGITAAFHHPMRLGLTVMSVSLGVVALMAFTSLGERQLNTGPQAWTPTQRSEAALMIHGQGPRGTKVVSLEEARLIAAGIRNRDKSILGTALYRKYTLDVGEDKQRLSVNIATKVASSGEQPYLRDYQVAMGRDFTAREIRNGDMVCLISKNWLLRLTGSSDPIGRPLTLNGCRLKIVGTFDTDGSSKLHVYSWQIGDLGQVVMPFKTAEEVLERGSIPGSSIVRVYYPSPKDALAGGKKLGMQASMVNPNPGYAVATVEGEYENWERNTSVARMVLGMIGGLTLSIALMSLLNMTLVALSERIQEIGLRRALGARRGEIVMQFAAEASMVAIAAWGIGIGLSALLIAKFTSMTGLILPFLSYWVRASLTTTLGLSLLVSVVPAWLATRVTPAVALRYE